jgi:HlyD family secretion protein
MTADRAQADAELRLLRAGSRVEDIRQAEAQASAAGADRGAAEADLTSAKADEARFEHLVQTHAGSEKQRDDAVTRRQMAEAKLAGTVDRIRAAADQVARLKSGARPEEIQAAKAHLDSVDAQIAALKQQEADATIVAPSDGIVTSRLVEPGELVTPNTPLLVVVDLDHAWANVYVEEPLVPGLKLDEPAVILTDAGQRLDGHIAFISPQAEFTPRNVQTADERAKLVYRVKVEVDNTTGVLKPGMPVTAEFGGAVVVK